MDVSIQIICDDMDIIKLMTQKNGFPESLNEYSISQLTIKKLVIIGDMIS
jgi:hypothetical protein